MSLLSSVASRRRRICEADKAPTSAAIGLAAGVLVGEIMSPPASCARGDVAAKTGSLTGVSTLAGITQGKDGQWRSFAIMVNQRPSAYPSPATSLAIDTIAAVVRGCA